MKKVIFSALCGACALLMTSCAMTSSPVTGFVYQSTKGPITATSNNLGSKVGTSQATSILGWFATGDASIEAAAKSAGIKKISHVDYEGSNILGLFAKHTTIVYGE
jgi:ABC-type sugar transport system substrate-binding protein